MYVYAYVCIYTRTHTFDCVQNAFRILYGTGTTPALLMCVCIRLCVHIYAHANLTVCRMLFAFCMAQALPLLCLCVYVYAHTHLTVCQMLLAFAKCF